MACFRIVTEKDIEQLRASKSSQQRGETKGWQTVPSDPRYEEKIVRYATGRITRMTRPTGRQYTDDYPHTTEFYNPDGSKKYHKNDPRLDAHYSESEDSERQYVHRNRGAILDDLGIKIRKIKK